MANRYVKLLRSCFLLLLVSIRADIVSCQTDFIPIPLDMVSRYHFDFERNFYADPAAEQLEQNTFYADLEGLERLKGKISRSSTSLLAACQLYDEALIGYMRLTTFYYLKTAVNTRDSASNLALTKIDSEFTTRTAFVQQELMGIDKRKLARFVRQRPKLAEYVFAVESAVRFRPHTLSLDQEGILGVVSPLAADWQRNLFSNILDRTDFGKIHAGGGEMDVLRDRTAIKNDTDRSVREIGFKKLYLGFSANRDLYAFALINLARARDHIARLRHFKDAASEVFFQSYWTKDQIQKMLLQTEKMSGVYRRYQKLRSDFVKKDLGYKDVNIWDISAATSDKNGVPRFTITQASSIILEALNPLGREYNIELRSLLDPSNGRLDVVPGPNRKFGGFSKGFPGVTTVFFSSGFAGYYNDMRILTHESTHAVHRQLMNNNHVLPDYAAGPNFLFESFAIFNELLLANHLFERESDPNRKRYFLEQFFDGKGMTMFAAAEEEMIEMAIYDGVDRGEIESADDLDKLTRTIAERFSIWPAKHEELRMEWITSSLFYEDPFYDVNYVYGSLLALKYLEQYEKEPKKFIAQYVALLKNGFNAPPKELLMRFLKIDIGDPRLIDDAVRLLDDRLDVLQKEYSR